MTLGLHENTYNQLHWSEKYREELFVEGVLQFSKKIANLEMHSNFRRSLLTFVRGKGRVQFQGDEILLENFMGAEIAQDEIGWDNIMEVWVARAWRDIQEQNLTGK